MLFRRAILYVTMLAGNAVSTNYRSHKLHDLQLKFAETYLSFLEKQTVHELCTVCKWTDHPTDDEWKDMKLEMKKWGTSSPTKVSRESLIFLYLIKKANKLTPMSPTQVYKKYMDCKSVIKNFYIARFDSTVNQSGKNYGDAVKDCCRYHWMKKTNDSQRKNNNSKKNGNGGEDAVYLDMVTEADCPESQLYSSKMAPEAIIFILFRDHSIFDLSTTIDLDEQDKELQIEATKKKH